MGRIQDKRVVISGKVHGQATATAAELGMPLGEFCDAAVGYFAQRGLDPRSTHAREGAQMIGEIRKLGDRLFSFLQVQEQGLLLPLLRSVLQGNVRADSARRQAGRTLLLSLGKDGDEMAQWEQDQQTMMSDLTDKALQHIINDWVQRKASKGQLDDSAEEM